MHCQPIIGDPEAAVTCSDFVEPVGPIVVSIPHGGRYYPEALMAQTRLDLRRLRGFEDFLTDQLFEPCALSAGQFVSANYARAWLDCNRAAWEMEKAGVHGVMPMQAETETMKARVGLGFVPTRLGLSRVYHRKLNVSEIEDRHERVWKPYHDALRARIRQALNAHDQALLIDCHSMPGQHLKRENGHERTVDIVIGDGHGRSCDPVIRQAASRYLEDAGFVVTENHPYAGGYITSHYGSINRRLNALQIEVRRTLYCHEDEGTANPQFDDIAQRLGGLVPYLENALDGFASAMVAE